MIGLGRDGVARLRALEESLWVAETRFDPAHLERTLAPDFVEIGCSGRVYARDDILAMPARPIRAALPLADFRVHALAIGVAHVTYTSVVAGEEGTRTCHRSSIWCKAVRNGWQLRFHQGTPASPSPPAANPTGGASAAPHPSAGL